MSVWSSRAMVCHLLDRLVGIIYNIYLGIWDCLSSQQVIDVVRRQVAERKELTEIAEGLCDRCTAPDSDIGGGIGCDNMTFMVVAVLNGRTKEQWYDWMVDRVEKKHGYDTPETLPQIYAPNRIRAAQERAAGGHTGGMRGPAGFGALARVLGAGGVTSHASGISSDAMFDHDDSDEYESGEDEMDIEAVRSGAENGAKGDIFGRNPTTALRAQLEELDDQEKTDHDGDSQMDAEANSPFGTNSTFRPAADAAQASIISPLTEPTSTGSPLIPTPDILLAHNRPPSSPLSNQATEISSETPSSNVAVNGISSPSPGAGSPADAESKKAS